MNDSEGYNAQMNRYGRRAKANYKVQIIHIIQSFSQEEIFHESPDDVLKVNMICQRTLNCNKCAVCVCKSVNG